MNILEALAEVQKGKIVRAANEVGKDVHFVVLSKIIPFDKSNLYKIELRGQFSNAELPKEIGDLELEDVNDVCLDFMYSTNHSVVSSEEMFAEIQKEWNKHNKE